MMNCYLLFLQLIFFISINDTHRFNFLFYPYCQEYQNLCYIWINRDLKKYFWEGKLLIITHNYICTLCHLSCFKVLPWKRKFLPWNARCFDLWVGTLQQHCTVEDQIDRMRIRTCTESFLTICKLIHIYPFENFVKFKLKVEFLYEYLRGNCQTKVIFSEGQKQINNPRSQCSVN